MRLPWQMMGTNINSQKNESLINFGLNMFFNRSSSNFFRNRVSLFMRKRIKHPFTHENIARGAKGKNLREVLVIEMN